MQPMRQHLAAEGTISSASCPSYTYLRSSAFQLPTPQMMLGLVLSLCLVSGEMYQSTPGSFFVFDSVGIDNPTFYTNRTRILFKLPALPEWTGMIALKPDKIPQFGDLTIDVGKPPLMGDNTLSFYGGNRVMLGYPHARIASGFLEEEADWFFLLEGNNGESFLEGPSVKFAVDVALQHTVEAFVEEWTVPFTAYKGQYSILRFRFRNDSSFKAHERIGIYQREPCPTQVFVGYDRLPDLTFESMAINGLDSEGTEMTFWVHQHCKVIYLVLLLKQDCLDLAYKVSKTPPSKYTKFQLVEVRQEISIYVPRSKPGDAWNLYGILNPFGALKVNVTRANGASFDFINVRASQ